MSSTPLVSIGLPVRDGERYLAEAIASIRAQTYEEWELLVGDNGSSDSTEQIVRDVMRQDDRITYLPSGTNRGAAWNFSRLVEPARGQLFKWATHDDAIEPTMLAACVAAREADPDAILWYPRAREIDADGQKLDVLPDRLPLVQQQPAARVRQLLDSYEGSNPIFGLMDMDLFRTTRLLDDFHSSDIVLLVEMALRGRFVEVDEPLFLRRWMFRSTHVRTDREVNEWYNPDSRRVTTFRRTRLLREMGRSVATAPIPVADRVASARAVAETWGARYWRHVGAEFRDGGRRLLGRA